MLSVVQAIGETQDFFLLRGGQSANLFEDGGFERHLFNVVLHGDGVDGA